MKSARQDEVYLQQEGDAFFDRNIKSLQFEGLRPGKRKILAFIEAAQIKPRRVLEYGCNVGDLLAHFAGQPGCESAVGVEVSQKAIDEGRRRFGTAIRLERGTIADNAVNGDGGNAGGFDLVVIDDVFCWVSRPTLLQSVANVDDMVADGGYLFIRDFYPKEQVANRNHHVSSGDVFCFKVPGSHTGIFLATGLYQIVSQAIYDDVQMSLSKFASGRRFEQRWADTILQKSSVGYNSMATQPK